MRGTRIRVAWRVAAATAVMAVVAAGCASSGSSASGGSDHSSLCDDYAELATVHGTDKETLHHAADLYRKVAGEAPTSVQDDLRTLADDEEQVAAGHAAAVDNSAAEAAARRADDVIAAECGHK
jgi:hypothetical protein